MLPQDCVQDTLWMPSPTERGGKTLLRSQFKAQNADVVGAGRTSTWSPCWHDACDARAIDPLVTGANKFRGLESRSWLPNGVELHSCVDGFGLMKRISARTQLAPTGKLMSQKSRITHGRLHTDGQLDHCSQSSCGVRAHLAMP